MSLRVGVTRILVYLLILRALAAPIAVRPESSKSHANDHRLVIRRCMWPHQGPQRWSNAQTVALGSGGSGDLATARALRGCPRTAFGALTRAGLRRLVTLAYHDPAALRAVDGPRC